MKRTMILFTYFIFVQLGMSQVLLDTQKFKNVVLSPETAINTPNTEFSPVFYDGLIGYVYSSRKGKHVDNVIKEPFYDIGFAAVDTTERLMLSASFPKTINSEAHEGPFHVHNDTIYFTRVVKTGNGLTRKIFYGDIKGENIQALPFSTDNVSIAHPTLSSDGNTIIFSANINGEEKMNLYEAKKINGVWSSPMLLSNAINSEAHELFPILYKDSCLIFTSDKTNGIGKYDLYISVLDDQKWSEALILPEPFNSPEDDFSLILSPDATTGYFTSNRPGGEGKDDIYRFDSPEPIISFGETRGPKATLLVIDKLTFSPIQNATVQLTELSFDDSSHSLIHDYSISVLPNTVDNEIFLKLTPKTNNPNNNAKTDTQGACLLNIQYKYIYLVSVKANGYNTYKFLYSPAKDGKRIEVVLEP